MPAIDYVHSDHFQLEEVGQGVYAALVRRDGLAIGNAGIVDLGDQTIIFDTFEDPLPAEDLRRAAESLTGRPATYIVNSHTHADHWYGNQVFDPSTPILATPTTYEAMAEYVAEVKAARADPSEYDDWLQELGHDLAATEDPHKRQSLEAAIRRVAGNRAALATLQLRRPNLHFQDMVVFRGSERTAELVTWGGGHTDSDAMLFLHEERIAFTADICFFERQPYMADGHPAQWKAQLERLLAENCERFVPGHGPVGVHESIRRQLAYFRWLEKTVLRALAAGESPEDVLARPMPDPFSDWSPGGLPAEANVRLMFAKLGERPD